MANVSYTLNQIIAEGARGVQLFYIISALTLFLSFYQRSSLEKYPVRNFYLRRIFRIAPMFYLSIIIYLFIYGLGPRYWLGDCPQITASNVFANFTFLHGINPYWINSIVPGGWSIAVEMMFYVIFPLLFKKVNTLNQAFAFFNISLIIRFVFQLVLTSSTDKFNHGLWHEYLFLYFPGQLPLFAIGILLYFKLFKESGADELPKGKNLLLFALLCSIQLLVPSTEIFSKHILFGVLFYFVILGISKYNTILLNNVFTRFVGKISFSMYLVHFAVLEFLKKLHFTELSSNSLFSYIISLIMNLTITITISFITFKLIEEPCLFICKKWIQKVEGKLTY